MNTHKYDIPKFNLETRGRRKIRGNYMNTRKWTFTSGSRTRLTNIIKYRQIVFINEGRPFYYNLFDCQLFNKGYSEI